MWLQISSGQGPEECELAVRLFLKALQNECKDRGIAINIIALAPGARPENFKSVLLAIEGEFKITSGTILWICQSPYRPYHKRKNWFINIELFSDAANLTFSEKDIIYKTLRSSGPGGQNVNKVESAVRVTHLPTGLTVIAREERSQQLNKKLALARLASLIAAKNAENASHQKSSLWQQHNTLMRGNPVRIYEGKDFRKI
jgi:peptide chain release factor